MNDSAEGNRMSAPRLYAKLVRAEQRVTDLKLVKKAESRRADHAESERDSRLVREWLRSPEALTIATDAWRRNVPGSQGENVLADVLAALAATPDTPASPPRYSTEQARMRLREVLTTAEWPEDGTAEEYFIREVFPDDPEPDECDHELKMSSYGRCVKCGWKPDENDGPASPVLGDEERASKERILELLAEAAYTAYISGGHPSFAGLPDWAAQSESVRDHWRERANDDFGAVAEKLAQGEERDG